MPFKVQDDELVMSLVEIAMAQPAGERLGYVEHACKGDSELLEAVWNYVEAVEEMGDFMLTPVCSPLGIEDPFEPGQLLVDRFRIVREVARGGMGIVYEAVDERLERRIALKCAKLGFRKRLPPEARNASDISHPNVCKIFEIHTANTNQGEIDFLTMEFLDGETLAARLRGGPPPEPEARFIALQLCAGLAEAHHKQVVHGDLKAGNVIVTNEACGTVRAVITDFGLAHRPEVSQVSLSSITIGGTPDYMAPELWKGAKPSVASDIFALGVLLRELAYGTSGSQSATARHSKWDPIIQRCVDENPARRFASPEDVAHALAPRTRRWALTALAAAVLAVVSGVVTYRAATAPLENVRLAVLPFEFAPAVSRQFASIKSSPKVRFDIIPFDQVLRAETDSGNSRARWKATHVLTAATQPQDGKLVIHADISDTRSKAVIVKWTAAYPPDETRHIPTALAGLVTGAFHLPLLVAQSHVNAAARQDYLSGLHYLRRNSTIDSAFPPLERAVAADPDSPLTHAAMAEAYWWKYQVTNDRAWIARSEAALRRAEQRNPDLPEVLVISGLLLANTGRLEQAQTSYLRAIEIEPLKGDAYRRLGMVYQTGNDDARALAALRRAIEVEPANHRNHQAMGAYYTRRAEFREALTHFARTAELEPLEPAAHFGLGTAFAALGRFAEAEKATRTALDLGETPAALTNLGVYLAYQGRDQEGLLYFNRALRWWPEYHLLWLNLGDVYRRLSSLTYSQRSYRRALELAEAEVARNPRGAYERACLAYSSAWLGDRRRAGSEIAQALQLAPDDAAVLRLAAKTYEALGQRKEALSVLASSPPDVLADLGRWPDLADLHRDSRFQKLMADTQPK